MNRQELLTALKDIAPPAEPAWWLPAPGHIAVATVIVAGLALFWLVRKRRHARRIELRAQRELDLIRAAFAADRDAVRLARNLSPWLKQVAMLAYPRHRLAAATGEQWLRFLDSSLGDRDFTRGCGKIFADAVYQPSLAPDGAQLLELCQRWLAAVAPRLKNGRAD